MAWIIPCRSPWVVCLRVVLNWFGDNLTHSIACIVLSRGFGLGLWWRIGASTAMAIALGIVAVQIPISAWWLSRYQFGPAEWVWRRLTYQQPLPMRRP